MSTGMGDAIRALVDDKISEDQIKDVVIQFLLAAYKQQYGTDENAEIKISDDGDDVAIYARKKIVDTAYNAATEIELEDALELLEGCEIGDEISIPINPKEFTRKAIMVAKQQAKQRIKEIKNRTLSDEMREKNGQIVFGYPQREKGGTIFVDLGKGVEGVLPKKYQSPRETYPMNERIKALVVEVNEDQRKHDFQVVLSRTHSEFVQKLFEAEVPEIYDHTVEIYKIVRDPGYRTKMAVFSKREDVDPVGACVGLKGQRIQTIVRELEGEKIDAVPYSADPKEFIKNALNPAEVKTVLILDEAKRSALAIVEESQFSLAIGKQGQNVKLANRLVDWNIDVKTVEQFSQMDISIENKRAIDALFSDGYEDDIIVNISELPSIPSYIVQALSEVGITKIEELINMSDSELSQIDALSENDILIIRQALEEIIEELEEQDEVLDDEEVAISEEEIMEGDSQEEAASESEIEGSSEEEYEEEEIYECPECGGEITIDMKVCPNCGVELEFEFDEEEDEE